MSDINTMNDFGELHWAYSRFEEAAGSIIDVVGKEFLDEIDGIVSISQLRILPMITSFSTDGDVLSQWRAYANDGTGIALGFDSEKINSLSVRVAPVLYNHTEQVRYLIALILSMHEVCKEIKDKEERKSFIFENAALMGVDMAFFKNPAFDEEKEIRIIRGMNPNEKYGRWSLIDPGGSGEKISRKKIKPTFRSGRNGGIISYIKMPLNGLGDNLIKEVIIGPKSINNGVEVSMALSAAGYKDFRIKKSSATYR